MGTLIFFLIILAYILFSYFILKYVSKKNLIVQPYLRLFTVSFFYALLLGPSIITSGGGEPGFAIPAPNLVAIIINPIYFNLNLILSTLAILVFWWLIIFIGMSINHFFTIKSLKKELQKDTQ